MSLIELSIGTWRLTIGRTPPKPMDLARLYDHTAWRWHPTIGLLGYSRAYTKLFNKLETDKWLTGLRDGAKILDGGIGTAALSIALANTIPYAYEIQGIDIAPRMLARARDNLRRLKRPGLTAQLRYGDVDCLPYPEGNFDMVMSAHLLEHSLTPTQTIKEMIRVLRVGAPLLIVTTRTNRTNALHGIFWRYRSLESRQLLHWMYQAGLCDVRRYTLGEGLSLPGLLSEAYVGRKVGDKRWASKAAGRKSLLERSRIMGMNRIQFQAGMSVPEFQQSYGSETQCEVALTKARWPKSKP